MYGKQPLIMSATWEYSICTPETTIHPLSSPLLGVQRHSQRGDKNKACYFIFSTIWLHCFQITLPPSRTCIYKEIANSYRITHDIIVLHRWLNKLLTCQDPHPYYFKKDNSIIHCFPQKNIVLFIVDSRIIHYTVAPRLKQRIQSTILFME